MVALNSGLALGYANPDTLRPVSARNADQAPSQMSIPWLLDEATIYTADSMDMASSMKQVFHDLSGLLNRLDRACSVIERHEQIDNNLNKLKNIRKSVREISNAARNVRYQDSGIEQNIKIFVDESKILMRELDYSTISMLKSAFYDAFGVGIDSEDQKSMDELNFMTWIFECNCIALNMLLNSILDPGQKKVEPVDIHRMIDIVAGIDIEQYRLKLVKDYEGEQLYVNVNEGAILRVLINILRNVQQAVKSNLASVCISTRRHNGHVKIVISDTGPGMPQEMVGLYNSPQALEGLSSKGEGRGIGISTIKLFIEHMNGSIHVASRHIDEYPQDHGTDLTIILPSATAPKASSSGSIPGITGYEDAFKYNLSFIREEIFHNHISLQDIEEAVLRNDNAYSSCFAKGMPLTILFKPDIFMPYAWKGGPEPSSIAITVIPDKAIVLNPIFSASKASLVKSIAGVSFIRFKSLDDLRKIAGNRGLGALLGYSLVSAHQRHLSTSVWDTAFDGASVHIVAIKDADKRWILEQWAYSSTISGILGNKVFAKVSRGTSSEDMAAINTASRQALVDLGTAPGDFFISAMGSFTPEQRGFSQIRMAPAARSEIILMEMILNDRDLTQKYNLDLDERTVILKGFDGLASNLVAQIASRYTYSGYKIIGISDRNGAILNRKGLSIKELLRLNAIIKSNKKIGIAQYYNGEVEKRYTRDDAHKILEEKSEFVVVTGGNIDPENLNCKVLIDATESGMGAGIAQQLHAMNETILFMPSISRGAEVKLASEEFAHSHMQDINWYFNDTMGKQAGLRRKKQFLNRHFLDNINYVTIVNMLYILEKYKQSGFMVSPDIIAQETALKIKNRKSQLLETPSDAVKKRQSVYMKKHMPEEIALIFAASEIAREEEVFGGMKISSVMGRINIMDDTYNTMRNIEYIARAVGRDSEADNDLKKSIISELVDIVNWSTRPMVKSAACEALGIIASNEDSDAIIALQNAAQDNNDHVSTWAVWALERMLTELPAIKSVMVHKRVQEYVVSMVKTFEDFKMKDETKKHIAIPHYWQDWLGAKGEDANFIDIVNSKGTREDIILIRANFLNTSEELSTEERERQMLIFAQEFTRNIRHTYKHSFAVAIADDIKPSAGESGRGKRIKRVKEIVELLKTLIAKQGYDSRISKISIMSTHYDLALLEELSEIYARELDQIQGSSFPQSIFVTDTHGAISRVRDIVSIGRDHGVDEIVFNGDYFGKDNYPSFSVIDYFMNHPYEEGSPKHILLAGASEIIFVGGMLGDDAITPRLDIFAESEAMREALNVEHESDPSKYKEFFTAFPEGVTRDNYRFHPKLLNILEWMIENIRFTYYRNAEGVTYSAGTLSPDFEYKGLKYLQALDEMDKDIKAKMRQGHELLRLMSRIRLEVSAGHWGPEIYAQVKRLVKRELVRNDLYERQDIPNEMLLEILEFFEKEEHAHSNPIKACDMLKGILEKKTRPLFPVFYKIWGAGGTDYSDRVSPVGAIADVGGFKFASELKRSEESETFLDKRNYYYIVEGLYNVLKQKTGRSFDMKELEQMVLYLARTGHVVRDASKHLHKSLVIENKEKALKEVVSYIKTIPGISDFLAPLTQDERVNIVLDIVSALDKEKVEKACLLFGINKVVYKYIFRQDSPELPEAVLEHAGIFRIIDNNAIVRDILYPFNLDSNQNRDVYTREDIAGQIAQKRNRVTEVLGYYDIIPPEFSKPIFIKSGAPGLSASLKQERILLLQLNQSA
jgi:signal transduction histidine kinase